MSVDNWWLDPEQLRLFEERLAAIRLDRRDMLRYAAAAAGSFAAAPGVFRYPAGAGRDALSHDFNFDLYCQGDSSLFAGLGKFDPDLKAVPDMAERWESNAD